MLSSFQHFGQLAWGVDLMIVYPLPRHQWARRFLFPIDFFLIFCHFRMHSNHCHRVLGAWGLLGCSSILFSSTSFVHGHVWAPLFFSQFPLSSSSFQYNRAPLHYAHLASHSVSYFLGSTYSLLVVMCLGECYVSAQKPVLVLNGTIHGFDTASNA